MKIHSFFQKRLVLLTFIFSTTLPALAADLDELFRQAADEANIDTMELALQQSRYAGNQPVRASSVQQALSAAPRNSQWDVARFLLTFDYPAHAVGELQPSADFVYAELRNLPPSQTYINNFHAGVLSLQQALEGISFGRDAHFWAALQTFNIAEMQRAADEARAFRVTLSQQILNQAFRTAVETNHADAINLMCLLRQRRLWNPTEDMTTWLCAQEEQQRISYRVYSLAGGALGLMILSRKRP